MNEQQVRNNVKDAYGQIAKASGGSCCAPSSEHLGYSADELSTLPQGADLGLGCGNPNALASLQPGERVVDLGCGAGIDVLLAAQAVGPQGSVIGVDMTRDMLAKARANVVETEMADRVDIREGHIEALPLRDGEVDVVISNCVINLSPDKAAVFREAFRALKPGGRLAVSDILLTGALPDAVRQNAAAWIGCIAGAELADDYLGHIRDAGFVDVAFTRHPAAELLTMAESQAAIPDLGLSDDARRTLAGQVYSYSITAKKPA
ncbi:MAG: arsenite methyltransferase [Myxococcales bacterium]|nr:arsenite methyltransferase [Myxococcales bacterium]